jgi:hypothetical protein
MPHAQVLGRIDLAAFHRRFERRAWKDGETVLKAEGCYLAHDGRSALVECLAVEGYLRQNFFVLLATKETGVMVRLSPRSVAERTEGVKRCVAWLALWLQAASPGARIETTNLDAELSRPVPEEAIQP